jgi:hypothetical protein
VSAWSNIAVGDSVEADGTHELFHEILYRDREVKISVNILGTLREEAHRRSERER